MKSSNWITIIGAIASIIITIAESSKKKNSTTCESSNTH